MRKRITKQSSGRRITDNMKEVSLSVNKAGLNNDGSQRWAVSIRFANESYKKVSSTGYVVPEIDDEMGRMYFVESNEQEGFKLSNHSNGSDSVNKHFTFTIYDKEEWDGKANNYSLLRDVNEQLYYIEF